VDVLAITFKLLNKKKWQPPYVSVIDCRGEKKWRSYYSKWHELAHLLTLTDQMRLCFARTHAQMQQARDPEEGLMEVIAGNFGFWQELITPHLDGQISFRAVGNLRAKLCPEASSQAFLIGLTNAWPSPCILIHAGLGLKKRDKDMLNQRNFGFSNTPSPELRALRVQLNESARSAQIRIFPNMRVPSQSIISKVFLGEIAEGEAIEDIGWWSTTESGRLEGRPIHVMARRVGDSVQALITPRDENCDLNNFSRPK
jgi:hypothetical protein